MADDDATDYFARNQAWVRPGQHVFNTPLPPGDEYAFRSWVKANKVPFDPDAATTDYDMRGFWSALQHGHPIARSAIDPNDKRLHYPDYWKTPYHETFSNESQWALPTAPHWQGDVLIDSKGNILFDDTKQGQ